MMKKKTSVEEDVGRICDTLEAAVVRAMVGGMRTREIAHACEVSEASVYNWRRSKDLDLSRFFRLALAIGADPWQLLAKAAPKKR